jgi:hypothetical protein
MAVSSNGEKYVFWISRFDRDPICIEVKTEGLPLYNLV